MKKMLTQTLEERITVESEIKTNRIGKVLLVQTKGTSRQYAAEDALQEKPLFRRPDERDSASQKVRSPMEERSVYDIQ
jgi:hypothetical protein